MYPANSRVTTKKMLKKNRLRMESKWNSRNNQLKLEMAEKKKNRNKEQ